jgi:soluble lytic murein transglycosylase-like protein
MFPTRYSADNPWLNRQLTEAAKYMAYIDAAAKRYGVQPSIIAGIGSRESRWGLALKPPCPDGTGDFAPRRFPAKHRECSMPPDGLGFGRGLMQIDYDFHEFARTGNWRDPGENILYGVRLLCDFQRLIARRTELTDLELLRAAIASYNAGPGRILRAIKIKRHIDHFTSGGDYSRDVLSRAGFFQLKGWR